MENGGPAAGPGAITAKWRDSRAVTRIIVPFRPFAGKYVWHCHILEHEDNEMMRPFEIVKDGEVRRRS